MAKISTRLHINPNPKIKILLILDLRYPSEILVMVPVTPTAIIFKPIHSGPNPQVINEKLNVPTNQDAALPRVWMIRNFRRVARIDASLISVNRAVSIDYSRST